MKSAPLLEVSHLKVHFQTPAGQLTAVDDVSFSVHRGEIVGIVGESGCGKSVLAQSLIRLLEHSDAVEYQGSILFEGEDILQMPLSKLRHLRGNDIAMIFQDPLTSFNPVYSIGKQIEEVLQHHQKRPHKEARAKAIELLRLTGIPTPHIRVDAYPHELSGGMQQRAMIAMALACEPKLLIADEPTTALDVTIQAQILELILQLNQQLDMAVLFITHDLGVVAEICDHVKVMYMGQLVEETTVQQLFQSPRHPYTQGLIAAIPHMDAPRHQPLHVIEGTVPSFAQLPAGCRFATRCPYADDTCRQSEPPVSQVSSLHQVKCWHHEAISLKNSLTKGDSRDESTDTNINPTTAP